MKINIKDLDKWVHTDEKFEKFKKKPIQPPSDLKKDKKKIKNKI